MVWHAFFHFLGCVNSFEFFRSYIILTIKNKP